MRNIIAIFLILASFGIYYGFTKNVVGEVKDLKAQLADYNDTIQKADQLEERKQSLTSSINSFSQDDKEKLEKMIPNNADNVRLIIDIQNIAADTGLSIKNIRVNEENKQGTQAAPTAPSAVQPSTLSGAEAAQKYSYVTLSFSVASNYENFVLFLSKLEQSLRLVDITALSIKAESGNIYNFDVTLRAYWLK